MSMLRARASVGSLVLTGSLLACGSAPPPPAAPPPALPVATARPEPAPDTSPVGEPPGLVLVGRVNKPEEIVSSVASWTKLPLPAGAVLVQALGEPALADVVDLAQPIDGAVTVALSRHGVEAMAAVSIALKGYDEAKAKLGATYRLVPEGNGQLRVEGLALGGKSAPPRGVDSDDEEAEAEEETSDEGCVVAPAPRGARLVCGERAAVDALAPYLSRTLSREQWPADVHLEVRPEPVRAPLQDMRSTLPNLARALAGSRSAAISDLVDAAIGEVVDFVGDAERLVLDGQIGESGIVTTTRLELQSNRSLLARAMTAERGDAPPAAFWRLPTDTDLAFFGRGTDRQLFEHPRELLANVIAEAAESASMPAPERTALKELVGERMLTLFSGGPAVYGKGFDPAGVEKARAAVDGVKDGDSVAEKEKLLGLAEQVVGWHLYQVSEPVAKVGPMLKDWSALWNRPAFAKWLKSKAPSGALPRMKVAALPAGVKLPKDTVHLEVTIPRPDVGAGGMTELAGAGKGAPLAKGKAPAKGKAVRPVIVHVLAVPDGGATWIAFGLDGKLVAQKALASLATSGGEATLSKAADMEALRDGALQGGGFMTLRGLLVFTALDSRGARSPFGQLASLPHKGATPILMTGRTEAPSAAAKAGASVSTLRVSRAVIEDIVKLAMSAR